MGVTGCGGGEKGRCRTEEGLEGGVGEGVFGVFVS